MIVIGIDPGLTRTGWAVISNESNKLLKIIDFGQFCTNTNTLGEVRLLEQFDSLQNLYLKYKSKKPMIAIERPFFTKNNPDTAFGTAQIAGFAMMLAAKYKMPVQLFTPSQVKLALTGSGTANKTQIENAIRKIFNLKIDNKYTADAFDAVAIAFTRINHNTTDIIANIDGLNNPLTKAQEIWHNALKMNKIKSVSTISNTNARKM